MLWNCNISLKNDVINLNKLQKDAFQNTPLEWKNPHPDLWLPRIELHCLQVVMLRALQTVASDGVTFCDLKGHNKHLFLPVGFYSNAKRRARGPIFIDF
jgi:hypothetical protein